MACSGHQRKMRSLYWSARVTEFYMEALTGLSQAQEHIISQGCTLESGLHCGSGGQNVHFKGRGGDEQPLPECSLRVNKQSCPLYDLLQQQYFFWHGCNFLSS